MAKLARKKGSTSQIYLVTILDSASTTGAGKTGLAYNTPGLLCRYISSASTLSAAITLEDITTLGTYTAPTSNAHIRFKEVSSADPSKGLYELQVHNDWMNLAGGNLVVMLAGAAGMAPVMLEIDLQADANVTHIQGDAQSATDLKDFVDAGYDPATNKVEGVKLVDTTTTNTDMVAAAPTVAAIRTEMDASSAKLASIEGHCTAIKGGTFNGTTDSLEAIRDRGDAAWLTATGFSTHAAADVWAVGARALTDKAGFELSTGGVDAVWDEVVEGGLTARQLVKVMAAALAGKAAGGGTTTVTVTGVDGVTTRITATVDANGNRSAVTINGA